MKSVIGLLSVLLGLLSVGLALAAIWYAIYSNRKQGRVLEEQTEKSEKTLKSLNEQADTLKKQTEEMETITSHLSSQAEALKEQTENMEATSKEINQIMLNLETRHVEPFPDNFDVIDNLLSSCEQDASAFCRQRIEIFTDVLGYGMLSKHSNWQKFNNKIKNIITKGHVEVFWCFYSGNLRNRHIEQQFKILKDSSQERKKYIDNCLENTFHCCPDPRYPNCNEKEECFVRHIYDVFAKEDVTYDDIIKLSITLQDMEENNVGALIKKPKTKLKIKKLKEDNEILPYHGWFIYEDRNGFKPVQAMISFPYYAKRREEGLVTKNQGIIEAFRSKLPSYEDKIADVRPDRLY